MLYSRLKAYIGEVSQQDVMATISPAEARAQWLAYLEGEMRASPHTVAAYGRDLDRFTDFLAAYHGQPVNFALLASVSLTDLRAFLADRRRSGLAVTSMSRAVSAVRNFYEYLAEAQGMENAAVKHWRGPKRPAHLPRPVRPDQAQVLLQCAKTDETWIASRDFAILSLLYGCGLRISEALSLKGSDEPLGPAITIQGKGGKQRRSPPLGG